MKINKPKRNVAVIYKITLINFNTFIMNLLQCRVTCLWMERQNTERQC